MRKIFYIFIAAMLASACSRTQVEPVSIVRLDTAIYNFGALDSARQAAAVDSLMPWLAPYFEVMRMPVPDVSRVMWLSQSEVVERFEPDVLNVWGSLNGTEEQIGSILASARDEGLDIGSCSFATVVWGFSQSIVKVDSVVLIALNHYLGADYPGYSHWEAYMRANKTPQMLPYNVAEALVATRHPFEPGADEPTLLSRMLYEGALVEAVMRLVPKAKEASALGYTQSQLEFARASTRQMWQEMAAAKMVYDTDPVKIDRLISPAPSSPLLGMQAPGRIGRYIGYEIVRKYISTHPDASLAYLLSPDFYGSAQSLIDSSF